MSSSELNTNDASTSVQSTEPTLCSNGCGFFGTAATKGLCSKCYRDLTKSFTPPPLPGGALHVKATLNSIPHVDFKAEPDQGFSWGVSSSSSSSEDAKSMAKKTNRCGKCNKKVGLTGFQCKCGNMFCGSHRYAEAHDCDFDFKAKGRSEIAKANPVVKADKLERL